MSEESRKFGAIGGKTRAAKLTKEQRSEAAKRAAVARWNKDVSPAELPVAEYPGVLELGGTRIYCAVLNDEERTRVLTQADLLEALGRHRKANVRNIEGEEQTPPVLQGTALKSFISKELREKSQPIKFRTLQGGIASGYRAEILPDVCAVYLNARAADKLLPQQQHIAVQAGKLLHGLATVGILAMVDEATGYEKFRPRDTLARILEKFVAKDLRPWVRTFPTQYYAEIYRLNGWGPFDPKKGRPGVVGHWTNNVVYSRLAPGVLEALRAKIERDASGRLKKKLFQALTEDHGDPRLRQHLEGVVMLMKYSPNWKVFMERADAEYPQQGKNYMLPFPQDYEPPKLTASTESTSTTVSHVA